MAKYLLYISTIVITFLTVFSFPQPAHAQSFRDNSGYIQMMIQLAMQRAAFPTAPKPITPTPTIYIPSQTLPTATPTPTKTPTKVSPTPTLTPTPTKPAPTPTATPKPTVTPTPTSAPTGDHMTFIMNEINKYRQSQGLSDVKTSTETCDFAAIRAHEITTNFSHDGFQQRINAKTIPYKTWTKITENLAQTSDYTQVVTLWKNSPGHAANMREDTPFVCVRSDGDYYAYEGMKQ